MIGTAPELERLPWCFTGFSEASGRPAIGPLIALLHQLAELVGSLTDEQYTRKPVGVVPGSIGGHVRHSLDHFNALLQGLCTGTVDYDQRQRGTDVECSRQAAQQAMRQCEQQLLTIQWRHGEQPLAQSVLLTSEGPAVTVATTLDRELAFVLSHTIHHNSLIAAMVRLLGVSVADDFGYAPSTLAYQEGRPCVR